MVFLIPEVHLKKKTKSVLRDSLICCTCVCMGLWVPAPGIWLLFEGPSVCSASNWIKWGCAIARALEAGVWGSESESVGKLAAGETRGVLVSCWRTVCACVCSCVASERICARICREAAAFYVQGVWDPELCLNQSHRVTFESRINLVRLAAGWPMWGWRLPWPKSNFPLCPPTRRLSWGQT